MLFFVRISLARVGTAEFIAYVSNMGVDFPE
jgi:hypothetical protein